MGEGLSELTRDLPQDIASVLTDLVGAARDAFGDDLSSVVLYGRSRAGLVGTGRRPTLGGDGPCRGGGAAGVLVGAPGIRPRGGPRDRPPRGATAYRRDHRGRSREHRPGAADRRER